MLKSIFMIIGLTLLLSACALPPVTAHKRYFWPLPVQGVEPKLEYLGFYRTDYDLKKTASGWVEEYVLGRYAPQALFEVPYDVSSYSGERVFVTDTANHQVLILDRTTKEVRDLKDKDGKTHFLFMPMGVYESAGGSVYVADSLRSRIYKYDAQETLLSAFGEDLGLVRPVAVAVNEQMGLLYVLDVGAHNVAVSDLSGNLMFKFGTRGSGEGQFNYPTDIDLDQEGNLYILDAMNFRVQVFDLNGDFLLQFGEQGTEPGSFRIPKGLAVSPQGDVYVTDSVSHSVIVFSGEGGFLMTLGDRAYHLAEGQVSPGGFYMPKGIDVDSYGGIRVVDSMNKMVHEFQYLTGEYLEKFPILEGRTYFPPEAQRSSL